MPALSGPWTSAQLESWYALLPTAEQRHCVKVVLYGNSGAGKSFLSNVLCGQDGIFAQRSQLQSVTGENRYAVIHNTADTSSQHVVVCDVPGLIESNQDNIARNKRCISKALSVLPSCPVHLLIVARCPNGRLAAEDLDAAQAALNFATLDPCGCRFVMNEVPMDEDDFDLVEWKAVVCKTLSAGLGATVEDQSTVAVIPRLSKQEKADLFSSSKQQPPAASIGSALWTLIRTRPPMVLNSRDPSDVLLLQNDALRIAIDAAAAEQVQQQQNQAAEMKRKKAQHEARMAALADESTNRLHRINAYSDPSGWHQPQYYRTIRVLRGEGDSLVLVGRGAAGLHCMVIDLIDRSQRQLTTLYEFTDATGWAQETYYETFCAVMFQGSLIVGARGSIGFVAFAFNFSTNAWSAIAPLTECLTDAQGWNQPQYYGTIRLVATQQRVYVAARSASGIHLWSIAPLREASWTTHTPYPGFADATGWAAPQYYRTMRAAACWDGSVCVCLRSASGVYGLRFDESKAAAGWQPIPTLDALHDAHGWAAPHYYETFQMAAACAPADASSSQPHPLLHLCCRGAGGVQVHTLIKHQETALWRTEPVCPSYFDAHGWAAPQYYSTMRISTAAAPEGGDGYRLFLTARGAMGPHTFVLQPMGQASSTQPWQQQPTAQTPWFTDGMGFAAACFRDTTAVVALDDRVYYCCRAPDSVHALLLTP